MDSSVKASNINILQPSVTWIGNRCYRVLLPGVSNIDGNYIEDDTYPDNTYEDEVECQPDFDVSFERLSNGKIRTSFAVASSYLPYIIGAKGITKHRIENETYTQIKIPSKGQVGDVVIIGKDLKTVRQARIKIEILVDQAKKRQPFTHFVSFPFNEEIIKQNFLKFKEEVLSRCDGDRGVEESLFQYPCKLHMTICALVLSDDRERQEAVKALEECHEEIVICILLLEDWLSEATPETENEETSIFAKFFMVDAALPNSSAFKGWIARIGGVATANKFEYVVFSSLKFSDFEYFGHTHVAACSMFGKTSSSIVRTSGEYMEEPMRVEMKGIEYLNDDPAEVDVLYGRVQTVSWASSLQEMVDALVRKLVKRGVASKQYENVKLHVTLMNTLFRSDKDGTSTSDSSSNGEKMRETFDARNVLKEFKDYYFGEMEISELHLSVRYTTATNGYYSHSCRLRLLPQ